MSTLSRVQAFAQDTVGVGVGISPPGKIIGTAGTIAKWITLAIVILLLIIAIILFATKSATAGIWVAGASVAIGSFYWYLSRDLCAGTSRMLGMGEFIDEAPIEQVDDSLGDLDDLKPQDWEGFRSG
jgi:hypothetical protein